MNDYGLPNYVDDNRNLKKYKIKSSVTGNDKENDYFKNKNAKIQNRRVWKRQARLDGKHQIEEALDELNDFEEIFDDGNGEYY